MRVAFNPVLPRINGFGRTIDINIIAEDNSFMILLLFYLYIFSLPSSFEPWFLSYYYLLINLLIRIQHTSFFR